MVLVSPATMPTVPTKTSTVRTPKVRTPAEEVWLLVQQWYFSRGKRVPVDEEQMCKDEIAKEAIQISYDTAGIRLTMLKDALSETTDFQKKAELMAQISECRAILAANPQLKIVTKAAYGSDSFWKEHWAKKKAAGWVSKKDAAAAAASTRK